MFANAGITVRLQSYCLRRDQSNPPGRRGVTAVSVWPFEGFTHSGWHSEGSREGGPVVVLDLFIVCEIWLSVGRRSPWPLTLYSSLNASCRGRHGWRENAPAASAAAGRGAEWSVCTRGRLGEAQGKLEVERWQEPWVMPSSLCSPISLFALPLLNFLVFLWNATFLIMPGPSGSNIFSSCFSLTSWTFGVNLRSYFDFSGCRLSLSSFLCDTSLDMQVK